MPITSRTRGIINNFERALQWFSLVCSCRSFLTALNSSLPSRRQGGGGGGEGWPLNKIFQTKVSVPFQRTEQDDLHIF